MSRAAHGHGMPRVTISIGLLLVALGYAAYFATGRSGMAPMLPLAFGVPMTLAGVVSNTAHLRRGAQSAATALALIGAGVATPAALAMLRHGSSAPDAGTRAAAFRVAMLVLCAIQLVACAVDARRRMADR